MRTVTGVHVRGDRAWVTSSSLTQARSAEFGPALGHSAELVRNLLHQQHGTAEAVTTAATLLTTESLLITYRDPPGMCEGGQTCS